MTTIGRWIAELVRAPDNESQIQSIRTEAHELSRSYPHPGALVSGD
jgi:hypothetical protein